MFAGRRLTPTFPAHTLTALASSKLPAHEWGESEMRDLLSGGIPREDQYRSLLESTGFKEMEGFSNQFLSVHEDALKDYARKWVADPLHQWSRQWEYPFVFTRVEPVLQNKGTARIFDAGSGVTFFPYYIGSQYGSADIHCGDNDGSLEDIFQRINSKSEQRVEFSCSDVRSLPYEDRWFDAVFCISVLEHTDDYEEIIQEFFRVLQPGGKLIVTLDVSLDGTRHISVDKGTVLLEALARRFANDEGCSLDLGSYLSSPGIFTTLTAKSIDPGLLPWSLPAFVYRMRYLLAGKGLRAWPPPITVFCLSLTKRADNSGT
jgi:SAM-dependent methyltransferase